MKQLNLPEYEVSYGGTADKPTIFDILRRRHVALTPEEWVRQHFIHYLINQKGYPQERLANEVRLPVGDKALRADSVLYNRQLQPVMIIEYKAPEVEITQKVFTQIFNYNLQLHADYLVVTNGIKHYCCKIDYENKKTLFLEDIPEYHNI